MIKSLIINPGSTSTKIGVFEDENLVFDETLRHSTEEIAQYETIVDQKDFRKDIIVKFNGEEIPMVPFVENIIKGSVIGMMQALKGYEEGADITIEIKEK